MSTFIKTYITAAPWRAILLYGLIFAILVGGIQVLVRYKNGESYTSGSWYEELAMWYVAGMFSKYVTWRAEGAIERKNARWKAKKK
jgi:hypothetical protein